MLRTVLIVRVCIGTSTQTANAAFSLNLTALFCINLFPKRLAELKNPPVEPELIR